MKDIQLKVITLKSKKTGEPFDALQVKVGLFSGLIIPNDVEVMYLRQFLNQVDNVDEED